MDLIDRQVAVDAIQQHREDVLGGYEYDEGVAFVYAAAHNHIIDVIKHLPSAQQECIHCKDCKYWLDIDDGRQKHRMCADVYGNWFCADAERRQDE
jgi:hypothetical protein